MRRICHSARRVLVDLGREDENTNVGLWRLKLEDFQRQHDGDESPPSGSMMIFLNLSWEMNSSMINGPNPSLFLWAEPQALTSGTGISVFSRMSFRAATSLATFSWTYSALVLPKTGRRITQLAKTTVKPILCEP